MCEQSTILQYCQKNKSGYKGYLTQPMSEDIIERVEDYIKKHKYNIGDILFVGSTYQSRQYYGLVLVMDEPVWFDNIWDAIFTKKNLQSLKQKGVKYRPMLQSAKQYTLDLLFGGDDYEDVIEQLKSHGLY